MAFLGVYGHVNVDEILRVAEAPRRDATVPASSRERRWGGTAANIALSAARLGVPVALASFVGEDFPPEYRRWLEDAGVDCSELVAVPGVPTPAWYGFVDAAGGTTGVVLQGPMADMERREHLDLTLLASDWVHLSTGSPAYWARVAADAKAAGKKVALDPGQELRFRWSAEQYERVANDATVLFLNQHELAEVLAKFRYGDVSQLHDHCATVVVTHGRDGATLHRERRTTLSIPVAPERELRDPTGAGDAFRAGFYHGLHRGLPFERALARGAAVASLVVEQVGAQPASIDRDEVEARAERVEAGIREVRR